MNAFSSGLWRCARSRKDCVSSTLEICLLASARASSRILELIIRVASGGLFDYFRNQVKPGVHERRNRLKAVVGVAFGNTVFAQAQADVLCVRHRLDAARIDRLQLFDEREHALQLRQHFLDLRLAQLETSELSDPCNIANT